MIEFFMPMEKVPTTTHQQKQINLKESIKKGKPIFYEPDSLAMARNKLGAHLSNHIPDEPFDSAVQCTVKWLFPSKTKKDGSWKDTKPDTHNLNKLLFDVMTDLKFWTDDALVVSEVIQKFWVNGSPSGIYIRIEEVT